MKLIRDVDTTSSTNPVPLLKTPPETSKAMSIARKTLTVDGRRAQTAKGLCFNCDEAYSPSHRCKGRLFRMNTYQGCLVEMCEEPPDKECPIEEVGATEISLQALSGTFNPRTLCLQGSVKGRNLTILIDSGLIHNFIQDSMAYKLGVGLQSLQEFRVFIGSGEYLVCQEVCRQVPRTIQEVTMTEDLYVLTMEGANIVLGIQWLETMGAVTCNYKHLTMEFQHQGRQVCLQGDTPSQISNGGLKSLVGREEVASANYKVSQQILKSGPSCGPNCKGSSKNFRPLCKSPRVYHLGGCSTTAYFTKPEDQAHQRPSLQVPPFPKIRD